jgi:hypothetical protein
VTAHELARKLLEGPDLHVVYFNDPDERHSVVSVHVSEQARLIKYQRPGSSGYRLFEDIEHGPLLTSQASYFQAVRLK